MTRLIRLLALAALLALAGCATTTRPEAPAPEQPQGQTGGQAPGTEGPSGPAATAPAADCPPICNFAPNAIDQPDGVLAERTIYFEFDSSVVRDQFMDIIKRHAAYLSQYPEVKVRLEGHTDERGSREYNIGLGARRAAAVRGLLLVYGVGADQISTISYGEEMPAVMGHGENAWSKNRRVELKYPDRAGRN